MFRNKRSLSSIQGVFFIVLGFWGLLIGFSVFVMENGRNRSGLNTEEMIMAVVFFLGLLTILCGIGMIQKREWARKTLLVLLYLLLLFIVGIFCFFIWEQLDRRRSFDFLDILIPLCLILFFFSYVGANIVLLNNKQLRDEFEEVEEESQF